MNLYYIVDLRVALGLDPIVTVEDICVELGLYATVGALIQVLGIRNRTKCRSNCGSFGLLRNQS